jgi:hypothetical protein
MLVNEQKEVTMLQPKLSCTATAPVIALLVLLLSSCGKTSTNEPSTSSPSSTPDAPANTGDYKVSFRVEPDPPAGAKENTVHVALVDGSGKPLNDAQVHVQLTMPAMPEMKMPEMSNGIDLSWNGTDYSGPIQITMAGGWNVGVEARRGGQVLTKYQTKLTAK